MSADIAILSPEGMMKAMSLRRIAILLTVSVLCALGGSLSTQAEPAQAGWMMVMSCDFQGVPGSEWRNGWFAHNAFGNRRTSGGTVMNPSSAFDAQFVCPNNGGDLNTGLYMRSRTCDGVACFHDATRGVRGGIFWMKPGDVNIDAWYIRASARSTAPYPVECSFVGVCSASGDHRLEYYVYPASVGADPRVNPAAMTAIDQAGSCYETGTYPDCQFTMSNDGDVPDPGVNWQVAKRSALDGTVSASEFGANNQGVGMTIECRAWILRSMSPGGQYCMGSNGVGTHYTARLNIRRTSVQLSEAGRPSTSLQITNCHTNGAGQCYFRAGETVNARATANDAETGVRYVEITGQSTASRDYRGNAWQGVPQGEQCLWAPRTYTDWQSGAGDPNNLAPAGGGGVNYAHYYYDADPCQPGANKSIDATRNTTGMANGTYSFSARSRDAAQNTSFDASASFLIDNDSPPTTGPDSCRSRMNTLPGTDAAHTAGLTDIWWRDTRTVTATVCDSHSGVASSAIEYRVYHPGGALKDDWRTLCAGPSTASGGAQGTVSCAVNTTQFNEGERLSFRVRAADYVGNPTSYSSESEQRRVDNTAPQVSANFTYDTEITDGDLADGTPEGLTAGRWTNDARVQVRWTQSAGNGTPIWQVAPQRTQRGTAPSCTRTGPLDGVGGAFTETSSNASSPATKNSQVYQQNRDWRNDACDQGDHTVTLTVEDFMGHRTTRTESFKFDSVAPSSISGLAVAEKDFTSQTTFNISWTSPARDIAPSRASQANQNGTVSPLDEVNARLGETSVSTKRAGTGAGQTGSGTIGDLSGTCLNFAGACSTTFTLPLNAGGGSYPLKVWIKDEAGNAEESTAEVVVLKFTDAQCTR